MGGLERYGTLPLGSAVCHRRFTLAGSRRGGRVAEGTRLLSEYGDQTPSRVRIPPSPFPALQWPVAAPVAQLDRASVYGTEGQRFESSRARCRTRRIMRICREFVLARSTRVRRSEAC